MNLIPSCVLWNMFVISWLLYKRYSFYCGIKKYNDNCKMNMNKILLKLILEIKYVCNKDLYTKNIEMEKKNHLKIQKTCIVVLPPTVTIIKIISDK